MRNHNGRWITAVVCLLLALGLAAGGAQAQPAPAADLLGYGKLQLVTHPDSAGKGVAVFSCESPARADVLLSKLRADFSWDQVTGPQAITLPGGQPAYQLDGVGVLVLAEKGSSVYALSAATPAAAADLLAKQGLADKATRFVEAKPRPKSLDYFDLHALDMYQNPMDELGQTVTGPWDNHYLKENLDYVHAFWAPYGFGSAFLPGDTMFGFGGISDGAVAAYPVQYCMGLARSHDQAIYCALGNGLAPWWMRDRFPRQMEQVDPHMIPVYAPLGCGGGTWLSYTPQPDAAAYEQEWTTRMAEVIKRAGGEEVACVRALGGGRPGDELGLHHEATEYMDYDEAGQAAFRQWLRDTRKLDLPALGERWYGDPQHFHAWDEVTIPSNFEFFGGFGDDTLNLLTGWQRRYNSPDAEAQGWGNLDYQPDAGWISVDLAPSMRQLLVMPPVGNDHTSWFRKEFDPTAWLQAHPGQDVYLVANTLESQQSPVEVWMNGAYLGRIRPKAQYAGPIAMQVTALMRPGRNVICLKVTDGVIYGPVFLTRQEPKRYPYLSLGEDARFVDMRDWICADRMLISYKRDALAVRRLFPETPMLLAPAGAPYQDHFLELKQQTGLSCIHDTGGFAGSYGGVPAGLGYTDGLYFTTEEGGVFDDVFGESRQLAWFLFEGICHHIWAGPSGMYIPFEQQTHWFANHSRLLELVGKTVRSRPQIAILTEGASARYYPYQYVAGDWDLGRGSLQSAHYNNAYVTETEVANGMVDQYPVLFDSNNPVMSDETIAAIERYVRAGGTFIAQHSSGRSSLTRADSWPLAKLTGFSVVGERQNMMITIDKDNPLLAKFAGMKFGGSGVAINWMGDDFAKINPPVALKAGEAECVPLAHWEDGTIAIGMRKLGKGRVIVLGSSFWYNKSDLKGNGYGTNGSIMNNFLTDLFTGLGVTRDVDCNSEEVWARRMETKNGLQDWMVLWNSSREAVDPVTVTFPLDHQPSRVVDMAAGTPVQFTYDNGVVKVAAFSMAANDARVLGVERGSFLAATQHWLAEKAHFESRAPVPAETKPLPPPPVEMPVVDKFRFRMGDAAAKTDLTWTTEPTTAGAWKPMSYGFWDEQGYPATGIGLYRATVQVPAAWQGKQVLLGLAGWDQPTFIGNPTIYLNGKEVGPGRSGGDVPNTVLDLTPFAHQGTNELAILVEAGIRGGFLGTIYITAQPPLSPVLPLQTGWKLYQDDTKFTPVDLPVKAKGRHLEIDVAIPADWKPDQIYLDFNQGLIRTLRDIVVNDRPLGFNWYGHAFPNRIRLCLYPMIKPGAVNRIELWAPVWSPTSDYDIQQVSVGVLAGNGR